jgi:uncharacterized protein
VSGRDVHVVYRKYSGALHWHQTMRYLGEDGHGVWLGAPAGMITQRGSEPPIMMEQPQVRLFPHRRWWTAVFNAEPWDADIYCDISTAPHWPHPGEVTMVDLDLDVIRRRADQRVVLLDQDEFAEHQVRFGYPAEVIRQAEQAAAWLLEAISDGTEPFGSDYCGWLHLVGETPFG